MGFKAALAHAAQKPGDPGFVYLHCKQTSVTRTPNSSGKRGQVLAIVKILLVPHADVS